MTVAEKYTNIWNKICDRVLSIPQLSNHLTLSVDNSDGWCDGASWYGENMFSDDDYLHITPIEKCGREVYGTISYGIGHTDSYASYRTYSEFEKHFNDFLNEINLHKERDY